mmetsp:Transcript_100409/g.178436  ORF Transcript_100409/g.178436 Transcript_100409/m.178436 type:complete len:248 (-) Transcript_100409:36-779(-)
MIQRIKPMDSTVSDPVEGDVKILTSTGDVHIIPCDASLTLGSLKERLDPQRLDRQRIFFQGRELVEDGTLQSFGVFAGHVLHLQIRPAPEAEAKTPAGSQPQQSEHAESSPQTEQRPWWYKLLVPSYSGTAALAGPYVPAPAEVASVPAPAEVTSVNRSTAANSAGDSNTSETPFWQRLLVPQDTGSVATLGLYAGAAEQRQDIPQGGEDSGTPPWAEMARFMRIGAPDPEYMRGGDIRENYISVAP